MAEYTASSAMLKALEAAGVTHLFVNLGSDHPAIMKAISKRKRDGKQGLKFITAPNEFVGLCAAQGFFQASGKMQAIIVHVDAGTLAMAGALHNVSRARIPVIMIAGTSPVTDENELEFIHDIQDTIDQRWIVRNYTVLNHEIRTVRNVKQLIHRAAQFSQSAPQGPSYLIASRETLEEEIPPYEVNPKKYRPLAPKVLDPGSVKEIGEALINAKLPVVITSPRDGLLEKADVILVIDSDVPWIKSRFRPSPEALIYHIDADPLKVNMSLFNIGADISAQADAKTALEQINQWLTQQKITTAQEEAVKKRTANVSSIHDAYVADVVALQVVPEGDIITPHYVLSVLKKHIDQDTLVLSEAISNYCPVPDPGHEQPRLEEPHAQQPGGAQGRAL
ncbi:hypothetical protein INS49_005462 [Diaporthe citri]|uniref:uncharacterized protein n=1 Tax=Diaporthe citri TaxID=83186 RepID=UPI001C80233C|nr:uncharacterized protein INS49_005462 [Diaporthe citri]KAG6353753.1 hypothetical protein INS49_005462 [Diaporthe citri]